MTSVIQATCHNCGSPLYSQWWSKAKVAYECRRCGTLTSGAPWVSQAAEPGAPSWVGPTTSAGSGPGRAVVGIAAGLGSLFLMLAAGIELVAAIALGVIVMALAVLIADTRARISALERRLVAAASPAPAAPLVPTDTPIPAVAAGSAPQVDAQGAPAAGWAALASSMAPPAPSPADATPLVPAAAMPDQPPAPPRAPNAFETYVARLQSASSSELEQLVAGRLLPIVGGVALVAAAILFLGLAFTRGWIGEEGRVIIGLSAGFSATVGGTLLLARGQAIIGHVLVGVGLAVVSLALFGATQLYGLVAPEIGVLGALGADLVAAAIAIRFRSQVIAGLGLVTVLVAPPLMGASASLITLLFVGVALVATTVIAVSQGWRWLPSVAFVLTAPQLGTYALSLPPPLEAVPVLLAFGVLNAAASVGEEWRVLRRDLSPSSAGLLVASAGFVVWGVVTVTVDDARVWQGVVVGAVGIAHLGLAAAFLIRGGDRHPFGLLAAGTGLTVVTLAVPIQLGGAPVPMIWAAEAVALTWIYVSRRHPLSGLAAAVIGLLAVGQVMWVEYPPLSLAENATSEGIPFANPAGLALLWVAAAGVVAIVLLRTNVERSLVAGAILVMAAWALPHEFGAVTLVWTLGLTAVVASATRWRWLRVAADDTFDLVPAAVPFAPFAPLLAVGFAALMAYGFTIATYLPPSALPAQLPGDALPFTDPASAAVAGLVISALAAGALSDRGWWRAAAVLLAAATVAYLLLFEIPYPWVVVGWSGLAAALLATGAWVVRERVVGFGGDALGVLAALLLLGAVMPLSELVADASGAGIPVLNAPTVAAIAVLAVLAFRAWLTVDPRQRLALYGAAGAGAVFVVSVAVVDTVEWAAAGVVSDADLQYIGQLALSVCWATLGVGILVAGLALRSLPVRVFGLTLLGIATVKVFIVDLAALDVAFRVLSFVGLGLLLIGAGWVYLRLQGRTAGRPAP